MENGSVCNESRIGKFNACRPRRVPQSNKGNGHRPLRIFGNGRILELQVPRVCLSQDI